MMKPILKSDKLANVCYDIRGPVLQQAKQMEDEGHKIIKLNIGNLAAFGFDSPEEIQLDIIRNLPNAAAYSDSKGIFAARKAVMHYSQQKHIKGVTLEGGITVDRAMETDSSLETKIRQTIQGAEIVKSEFTADNGCVVTLRLPKRRLEQMMGVRFE